MHHREERLLLDPRQKAMLATNNPTSPHPCEPLALANQLYREFHARCFWHSPRELCITEELLPFVVKGLRTHGGRRGFILAGKLQARATIFPASDRDVPECR
jgi:hypothetical protein